MAPEVLEAERDEFLKKSKPPSEPKVIRAGGSLEKPARSEDDLKVAIERIKKILDRTGDTAVRGKARVTMINRWNSLKRELKDLAK